MRMLAISETKPSYFCIVEMEESMVDNRKKYQFCRIGRYSIAARASFKV
jgi:hypothetical protein